VLSKESLSSLDVPLISDDSCFLVSIEKSAKTEVVSAISQNIERNTTFTLVVWLFNVPPLEEQGEIIFSDSENVLVRQNGQLFVSVE
jgi:hypothetical protein